MRARSAELRADRPDATRETVDRLNGQTIAVFDAANPFDFDWLERMILQHKYHEHPGVWAFGVDFDKRTMAEILAAFAPRAATRARVRGGSGPRVPRRPRRSGRGRRDSAAWRLGSPPERVRFRIHHGDLLTLDLPSAYDVVFGSTCSSISIRNRLADLHRTALGHRSPRCLSLLQHPGVGADPAFGTVFPLYVDSWAAEAAAGRRVAHASTWTSSAIRFTGHLVWADCGWWVRQFERRGSSAKQGSKVPCTRDGMATSTAGRRRAKLCSCFRSRRRRGATRR